MEKKEFQKIVKKVLKEIGFQFKGNNAHKICGDDYLLGICLEHHSYHKAYAIEFGVVYLPDDNKVPFRGWFDWHNQFLFTKKAEDDIEKYKIEVFADYEEEYLIDYFEYEERGGEELIEQIKSNIDRRMKVILEKEYVLEYYAKHIEVFARLPICTIEKLIKLYDFDRKHINRLRQQWGYDKFDF